jgi:hypothetical protein
MATYTPSQLSGTGSLGENISSGSIKTFAFTNTNPSTVYFTLETIPNPNGFYISGSTPLNVSGSWVVSASMRPGFITSSYIASVVVPPGSSALTFTPAISVVGTTYYLKGTGNLTLVIS